MAGYLLSLKKSFIALEMSKSYSLFIFIFLFIASISYGQTDLPSQQPLKIDVANKIDDTAEPQKGTSLKIPSVIDNNPEVNLDMKKRNPVKMLADDELVQAGTGMKIDPKAGPRAPKEGSREHFSDMYLGDVKSGGKFVGIVCRDHEFVDGDRVKIWLNGAVIDANTLLTASFKGINVDLEEGFNRFEFEALNVGSSPPNTAQVDVYDDKGVLIYSNKWLLSTGSRATLIVTKEAEE